MRAPIWAAVLTCVFAAPAYSQQGAPSAVPVGIVIAERKPISKTLDFAGRVAAHDHATRGRSPLRTTAVSLSGPQQRGVGEGA